MKQLKYIPWILFPLFITSIVLLQNGVFLEWGFDFNIIHNLCGISTLTHLGIANQQIMVNSFAFRFGLLFILLTILLGPFFCGYICPFGVYQKMMHLIGKNLNIKFKIPKILHRVLSGIKYLLLCLFIFLIIKGQVLVFINIEPYHAFIRLFYGGITLFGGIYLIIITLLSLVIKRPYCNYLCPYGAGFNLLSSLRVYKVKRVEEHCINCKICDKVCPVNIDISTKETVENIQCLSCHECIDKCPKEKALGLEPKYSHYIVFFIAIATSIVFILFYRPIPIDLRHDLVYLEELELDQITAIDEVFVDNIRVYQRLDKVLISDYKWIDDYDIRETTQSDVDLFLTIKAADAEKARLLAEEQARLEAEAKAKAAKAKAAAQAAAEAAAKAAAEAEVDTPENSLTGKYRDGVYSAKVTAYQPNMVVQIEIKNDVILSVQVLEHRETRSYFNFSAVKMYNKIVAANSPDVSVVSGATYTSLGIRNGVRACLNKAKY